MHQGVVGILHIRAELGSNLTGSSGRGRESTLCSSQKLQEHVGSQLTGLHAGLVIGVDVNQAGVEALAATPSKEVLIGKMMGSLMSSLYGLAYVLQAKIDKENGGDEATEAPAEA